VKGRECSSSRRIDFIAVYIVKAFPKAAAAVYSKATS